MNKLRSSHFMPDYLKKGFSPRNVLIILILSAISVVVIYLSHTTKCLVIKKEDGGIIYIKDIKDGDRIKISHINSIYDAKVEEVLYMEGDSLILKDIKTASYGVKEYYGITEGIVPRSFTAITFRNTKERDFSIEGNSEKVQNIQQARDTALTIEIVLMPVYRYYLTKLR